jgi:hypothetical protein
MKNLGVNLEKDPAMEPGILGAGQLLKRWQIKVVFPLAYRSGLCNRGPSSADHRNLLLIRHALHGKIAT